MNVAFGKEDAATRQVLDARAQSLARAEAVVAEEFGEEMVFFRLGDSGYGVPARAVREIRPLNDITPLPTTPSFVLGLANVRGRLITVVDLRPLLHVDPRPPANDAFLLRMHAGDVEIGLLADSVAEIRASDLQLAPAHSAMTERAVAWVRGVDQQLNLIIDPAQFIANKRLIVNDVPA